MVFCGTPSKACQRCRKRRLKCDFLSPSCSQCLRACTACAGYRDVQSLRVRDQTHATVRKARYSDDKWKLFAVEPIGNFPPSIECRARALFFAKFVTSTSKTLDFLEPYREQQDTPDYLRLSIDAVALAYFAHQTSSGLASVTAQKQYVKALRKTRDAIQCPRLAIEDTTLLTSFLLDLFEKLTTKELSAARGASWASHATGALALVRVRGFDLYRDQSSLRFLKRLCTNLLITCIVEAVHVPDGLLSLHQYVWKNLDDQDTKWRLSEYVIECANLRADTRCGSRSAAELVGRSLKLDSALSKLAVMMDICCSRVPVDVSTKRAFRDYYDVYPDRHSTQTWNVLRVVRILVLEPCLEYDHLGIEAAVTARETIREMAEEICTSITQYTDCNTAAHCHGARYKIDCRNHSALHSLYCYTLIFPMFVAARSKYVQGTLRTWVTEELHRIAEHFFIPNAEIVAQLLESSMSIDPWAVYARLGGYGFSA